MSEKVLVTGANGMLGTNVVLTLLSRGYKVKALLRSKSIFSNGYPDVEIIIGDISNKNDVEAAMNDCTAVIHIAAITDPNLINYSEYKVINVNCTKDLLNVAIERMVKVFVFVSSANVFGYGTKTNPGTEEKPIMRPFSESGYAFSKYEAHSLLAKIAKNSFRTKIIEVNPTFMLGEYDSKPSSGRIILMGYKKRIVFYPPGGKNFIHVKDAANGLVNAFEKGEHGQAYLLANQNMSYKEFFKLLKSRSESNTLLLKVPAFILIIAGLGGNLLRFFGIKTAISLTNMRILCISNYYCNSKAVDKLDLTITPISEAIDDAIKWFKKIKLIN